MQHLSFEMRAGSGVRTTLDFNSGGYVLLDGYVPDTREDERVTDKFDVFITGASESDLQSKVRAVELALDFATQHPSGPDGVWVLYAPTAGGVGAMDAPWQSRIVGGAVLHDKKFHRRWIELKATVEVVIERAGWWETSTPVTLAVSNGGGSSGAIKNHEDADAGDDFYLEIADTQVLGGMPCPAIIEFKNTTNDARTVDNLYVGHFAESKPATPPAATTLILEGTGAADVNCSSGAYAALPWTGTGENQLTTWLLASALLGQRHFKLIARFQAGFAYTDLWLKAQIRMGTAVIGETRWALMDASRELQLIGTLQIPPFRHGSYLDLGNLTVALYEKRAGGTGTINLDYIALLPQDSWRHYGAISGLAYNAILIDNPVMDALYTDDATPGGVVGVSHMVEGGQPILLQPGVKNIVYFLHDCDNGSAPIARTATVAVKYHPRRRTI